MYRCKECGSEYETKPDYCDCGNDEFEVIVPAAPEPEPEPVEPVSAKEPETFKTVKPAEQIHNQGTVKQKTFDEQYSVLSRLRSSVDPISGSIFLICLLLSFWVIFFMGNSSLQEIAETVQEPVKQTASKPIPNINTFWNNTPPKAEEQSVKQNIEEKVIAVLPKPVQNIIPQTQKSASTTTAKSQAAAKPQTKTTPVKTTNTTTSKPKTTTQTTKPASTTTTKPQTTQTTTKPQTSTTAAKPQTQTQTQPSSTQTTQSTATQSTTPAQTVQQPQQPSAAELAKQAAAAKQELANYKISLRNTIGRKIDFTKVIGDGSCVVAFKVNSSGQLVNRSFAQQSTNMTLNDAVYAAVMATPSFTPPPSAYKNETLNLTIKFYNGNFEILLQ